MARGLRVSGSRNVSGSRGASLPGFGMARIQWIMPGIHEVHHPPKAGRRMRLAMPK